MGVADHSDVFGEGRKLHGDAKFVDHFAYTRPYQMHAEDFVCPLIGQNFGEAISLVIRLRCSFSDFRV